MALVWQTLVEGVDCWLQRDLVLPRGTVAEVEDQAAARQQAICAIDLPRSGIRREMQRTLSMTEHGC